MSQGTPRKFSEKIAILERKQNEEEELFHSVMREVRGITSTKSPTQPGYQSPNGGMMSPNTLSPTTAGCSTMPGMPLPGTQLVAGPPHPLSMPPWNRPGGSLPNVHAMVQHPPQAVDPYAQWNYWQHPSQAQQAAAQAAAHRVRTRSPGATHYHPYMNVAAQRSNERGAPTMENGMIPQNVHLQLPDPSWSRARSDPAIHQNAMNALYAQQNAQQQWLRMNGMTGVPGQGMPMIPIYPVPSGQQQGQQQHSPPQHVMSPVDNRPQSSQGGGPPSPIDMAVGSLPNMHSPLMQQQQQAAAAAAAAVQQRSNSISCYPTSGSQPQSPMMTSAANSMPNTPGSYNPHQVPTSFAQQLATPQNFGDASQSAPTSPQAQNNYDAHQMQQQWTPTRHYSASPDAMDIPNIVLTGADGTLDCFQDLEGLHLDNEIQQLLSNGEQQVDPACENQLVN